jgi:phage terminase small subunit
VKRQLRGRGHRSQTSAARPGREEFATRREAFVLEYLKDLNATQAAIRAGYSRHTASQQGARLLRNVKVAEKLREAQAERKELSKIQSAQLEREAERIATSDIRRLFRDGRLIRPEEIPDDLAPAISSIVVKTPRGPGKSELVKVRFWDKNTAQRTIFQIRGEGKVNDRNLNVTAAVDVRDSDEDARVLSRMTPADFDLVKELQHQIDSVIERARNG